MATKEDVTKLAALSRITISDAELETFTKEFDAILAYVGQLESLELPDATRERSTVRNVVREDTVTHESGAHTEAIAAQFPDREGNALKVKQVISYE